MKEAAVYSVLEEPLLPVLMMKCAWLSCVLFSGSGVETQMFCSHGLKHPVCILHCYVIGYVWETTGNHLWGVWRFLFCAQFLVWPMKKVIPMFWCH